MLNTLNESIGYQEIVKALVLIDGTGSMQNLIDTAKNCIEKYFSFVCENLKDNKYSIKLFKMQIAIYRNYSSGPEEILEVSPWAGPYDETLKDYPDL